jgi:flagellin
MGLYVNTNVASINAQRRLTSTARSLSRSFQRLSSGLRINSAADDAAGLAISERLTSQIRGLTQASRNTNDGISLVQVAEASLEESGNILQRMRELSVQAANDINSEADRASIQEEIDQLTQELTRIGEQNVFNKQVLLDGSLRDQFLQVGMNFRETVKVRVRDARAFNLGRHAVFTGAQVSSAALAAGDVLINGLTIRATTASDDTLSTTLQTSSAIAKVAAINDLSAHTGVEAYVNATVRAGQGLVTGGTLDGSNYITINDRIVTGVVVEGGDADEQLIRAINEETMYTGVEAFRNAQNELELRALDGRNIDLQVVGNAGNITGLGAAGVTHGTLTLHSEDLYEISGADETSIGFSADQLVGVSTVQTVDTIDVTTREGASLGIRITDRALELISKARSELGALQNRLEATVNNLAAVGETASASRSRIRDADFAVETAELTRNQILQSAGTTVLAQANSATQNALSLLQ